MKRTTLTFLAAATLLAAACSAPMPRGNWSEAPHKALCKLMKDCKKESAGAEYNMNYAVFDYDNTTVMQDVELAVMGWQLENLRLRFTPEEVWGLFAPQIPDLDTVLTGAGAEGISARMLIKDIESDYRAITSAAGVRCGEEITEEQLAEARKTPEYEDFRAKLMALYEGTYETFDYREGLMIIVALFHNMTTTEMSALVKQAVADQVAKECLQELVWESPEMGAAGKVSMPVSDGLALSDEMRRLYKALEANGIDVYIFSASLEAVVEAMACDPEYLGLDSTRVFAIRLKHNPEDLVKQEYTPFFIRPYKEGKTAAIKSYVAPLYGWRDPVLVAGDSNGDYNMLTEFPDMRLGLIIDKNQTGPIGELRQEALDAEKEGRNGLYVLQRRADPKPEFSRE